MKRLLMLSAATLCAGLLLTGCTAFINKTEVTTEEKVTTRSEGKAAARPTDGGSVSSKNERKVLPGGLELPAVRRSDTLIYNEVGRYTFLYRPSCKVSQWVAYKLTRPQ